MPATPPTRRRWFQFGLGTMFWLMLVFALGILWATERCERQRLSQEVDQLSQRIRRYEVVPEAKTNIYAYQQEFARITGEMNTSQQEALAEMLQLRDEEDASKADKRPYHIPGALPPRKARVSDTKPKPLEDNPSIE